MNAAPVTMLELAGKIDGIEHVLTALIATHPDRAALAAEWARQTEADRQRTHAGQSRQLHVPLTRDEALALALESWTRRIRG